MPYISLLVAFVGLLAIISGLHSIDNAWNLRYINTEFNLSLVDTTTMGVQLTAVNAYNSGVMQVMGGAFLIIIGLLSFGFYETGVVKHGQ
jgi:uncharacterized membrane protein YphA (DoxX/SURF4 family)